MLNSGIIDVKKIFNELFISFDNRIFTTRSTALPNVMVLSLHKAILVFHQMMMGCNIYDWH